MLSPIDNDKSRDLHCLGMYKKKRRTVDMLSEIKDQNSIFILLSCSFLHAENEGDMWVYAAYTSIRWIIFLSNSCWEIYALEFIDVFSWLSSSLAKWQVNETDVVVFFSLYRCLNDDRIHPLLMIEEKKENLHRLTTIIDFRLCSIDTWKDYSVFSFFFSSAVCCSTLF